MVPRNFIKDFQHKRSDHFDARFYLNESMNRDTISLVGQTPHNHEDHIKLIFISFWECYNWPAPNPVPCHFTVEDIQQTDITSIKVSGSSSRWNLRCKTIYWHLSVTFSLLGRTVDTGHGVRRGVWRRRTAGGEGEQVERPRGELWRVVRSVLDLLTSNRTAHWPGVCKKDKVVKMSPLLFLVNNFNKIREFKCIKILFWRFAEVLCSYTCSLQVGHLHS